MKFDLYFLIILLLIIAISTDEAFATKPSDTLDMSLTVEEVLFIGEDYFVTLTFTPLSNESRSKADIEVSGVISLGDIPLLEWSNLIEQQNITAKVPFSIGQIGEGEIRGTVQIMEETGEILYGRRADLYFLATEEGVFTNNYSPLLLKTEHLKKKLELGLISQQAYQEELEKILGSGALETSYTRITDNRNQLFLKILVASVIIIVVAIFFIKKHKKRRSGA